MKRPKLYLETTIPSYLAAKPSRDIIVLAHQQITTEWWETSRKRYSIFISPVVLEEIRSGDVSVAKKRLDLVKDLPQLDVSKQMESLAKGYIKKLNIPNKSYRDAFHLAISVVHKMDILLTWNCGHLANENIRKKLREINDDLGMTTPAICTPEELVERKEDE